MHDSVDRKLSLAKDILDESLAHIHVFENSGNALSIRKVNKGVKCTCYTQIITFLDVCISDYMQCILFDVTLQLSCTFIESSDSFFSQYKNTLRVEICMK